MGVTTPMKNKSSKILIMLMLSLFATSEAGMTKTLSTSQLPPRNKDCQSNQQQPCWSNNMDIGVVVGDQYRNKNYKDHKGQHYNGPKDTDQIQHRPGYHQNNQYQNKMRTRGRESYQD